MKLPEFITYCALKDLIVAHDRLDHEYHANACNKQKIVIENDKWLATITYTHFARQHNVLHASLTRSWPGYDEETVDATIETIIDKFV